MMMNKVIAVWAWDDAPEELKSLSEHGGDEDWVALVPSEIDEKYSYIGWIHSSGFGAYDTSRHELVDGDKKFIVYIGAHA